MSDTAISARASFAAERAAGIRRGLRVWTLRALRRCERNFRYEHVAARRAIVRRRRKRYAARRSVRERDACDADAAEPGGCSAGDTRADDPLGGIRARA